MSDLWTDSFFPSDFSQFIGNTEIVESVKKWGENWEQGKKGKPLLLYGPTGTGKTTLALLAAKYFQWELFELNASDFRTKDVIDRVVGAASQGASFLGKQRLILLDEVDGLQARDKGGAAAISKILRESNNPVILTANGIYANQKLAPLRQQSELLQFRKINYLSIAKRLREILDEKKVSYNEEAVKLLAKNCNGDFRSALLDTQTLAIIGNVSLKEVEKLGFRERQENVFKVLEAIFKGNSFNEVRKARFQSEISNDLLFRWVEENIPRAYTNIDDSAAAFEMLSRADIFEGRISRRQHYGFKRYSSELFTAGIALSKQQPVHGWLKFQFPQLLKKLSASSSVRNLKKELGRKMGGKMHSSSKQVMAEDLAFFQMIFSNKELAVHYAAAFDLDEKELAFLLNTKPSTKKVQKILEQAGQLKQDEMLSKRRPFGALHENDLPEPELEDNATGERPLENDDNQTTLV